MTPALRSEGLCKNYGGVAAVAGVSLTVAAGEFVAITGPSGCGKSTLLSLLAGLEEPSAGEVWIEGTALATLDDGGRARLRRRTVGFVFQTFNLIPVLSLAENVALPQMLDGVAEAVWRPRVERALARVDLAHRASHLPSAASVGEQQRAAIARVLAAEPRIVFADEPTGSLDSARGAEVLRLLGAARDERGVTVVVVTHDATIAAAADRAIRMKDGSIVG